MYVLSPSEVQLLETIRDHPQIEIMEFDRALWASINHLESVRLIECLTQCKPGEVSEFQTLIRLLPEGNDALNAFYEADRKRAQDERERNLHEKAQEKRWRKDARRSWVQWTITTILTLASFFAGAVTEELTGFMEWVFHLFR